MTRTVYRITLAKGFQYFLPEKREDHMKFIMECKSKMAEWESIPVYIEMPFLEAGDLYSFSNSHLIVSPRAWKALQGYLDESGEVLPLEYDGETYGVVNVLMCINCLDRENTVWWSGFEDKLVNVPAFHPTRLPEPGLFKVPETHVSEFDGEDICFGLVEGFERELGYFSLREIEEVRGPLGLAVERDLYFEPKALGEIGV